MKRVGILTSGGDCPGLNTALVGIIDRLGRAGIQPVLIRRGFQGLLDAADGQDCVLAVEALDRARAHHQGGTALGSSRVKLKGQLLEHAVQGVDKLSLDHLVVIGGDGSLHSARRLSEHIPTVAIPKTIDNDVAATDLSIGFQSAVQTAADAIERIQDTAASHGTSFLIEVMGRRSGFLAAASAIAARADAVVVPEASWSLARLASCIRPGGVIIIAEGSWCAELGAGPYVAADGQLGGVVARARDGLTTMVAGVALRTASLGHTVRGGEPVVADRLLASRMAAVATERVLAGSSGFCVLSQGQVAAVDINATQQGRRTLSPSELEQIEHLLP